MHKLVTFPVDAGRVLHRRTTNAVKRRRVGNFSADYGLDALNFFLADLQTGFGPFIAIYLTSQQWSTALLGSALGIGTIITMIAQVPAGAAIDVIPAKRGATLIALLAVLASALLLALLPDWWPVVIAEVLHGVASCMLVPAVAAVTLSRVGRQAFAHRLGRNARFMALGNALGAAVMGAAAAYLSKSAPFWLTAATTLPAMFALAALPPRHSTEPRPERKRARQAAAEGWSVLCDRRHVAFAVCVVLFHMGNAFILPLAMSRLTAEIGNSQTNLILALCLVVSQGAVALIAPWIGRQADRFGRKPVLLIGFAAVPLHAALLALFGNIYTVIGSQLLDGVASAMFGVLQPLVAADITEGTNRFNLSLGVFGLAAGLGASLSNFGGGRIASFSDTWGFVGLTTAGLAAVLAIWALMSETRPDAVKK